MGIVNRLVGRVNGRLSDPDFNPSIARSAI